MAPAPGTPAPGTPAPSAPAVPEEPGPAVPEEPGPAGTAVTVAITRRADAVREQEMAAWVRSGLALAEGFGGFLGGGWVRAGGDRDEWHMLYRFSGPDTLATWEGSAQRQWWLSSAQGIVEHTRVERRTGIEGWFEPPADSRVQQLRSAPAPPRWKQAVTIWIGFFPLSLLGNVVLRATIPTAPLVLRILVLTAAQTPVMTYLLLPWLTRRLSRWLGGGARAAAGSATTGG